VAGDLWTVPFDPAVQATTATVVRGAGRRRMEPGLGTRGREPGLPAAHGGQIHAGELELDSAIAPTPVPEFAPSHIRASPERALAQLRGELA